MKHITRPVIFLLFVAAATTTSLAQNLYKYVDPDGKIGYSDRPPDKGRIEKTMKFENLPSSALPAATATYVEQLRRMRASSPASAPISGVVLYSAVWCGYCKQAKAYLASKGIAYQEIDIDTNVGKASFAQSGGGKGVPLLLADGQSVQGFSPAAYDALFVKRK